MLNAMMDASAKVHAAIAGITNIRDRARGMPTWSELSKVLRALEAAEMRLDAAIAEQTADACQSCGELPNAPRPVGTEAECPDCGAAYMDELGITVRVAG